MELKLKDRMIAISNQILNSSRNELYLSMRFLDIALSALPYELYLSTTTIGTDGEKILYNPNYLVRRYRDDLVLINRVYIHILLHCIFRHMLVEEEKDARYWNLASDIAVESIIDTLDYNCIRLTVSDRRNEIYDKLKERLKVLTAEGIYYTLKEMSLTYEELKSYEKEFVMCDHSIWERLKESSRDKDEKESASGNKSMDENNPNKNETSSGQNPDKQEKEDKDQEDESKNQERESKNQEGESKNQGDDSKGQEDNSKKNRNSSKSLKDKDELNKTWEDISQKTQSNLEALKNEIGDEAGGFYKALQVENRERYDYKDFLRKFSVLKEEVGIDMDSFDYVFYTYGLELYGNVPLIEPLEYKESNKIEEFVIVLDTSGSCSGDLIKKFLSESYNILTSKQSFHKKVNIYIIQCDDEIQSVEKITTYEGLKDYMDNFQVKGFGGTDFRPAFQYVDNLLINKEFKKLKGMLYFTDGYGIYPLIRPKYDVAFVFIKDEYTDIKVPSWAMKLIIEPGGFMNEY